MAERKSRCQQKGNGVRCTRRAKHRVWYFLSDMSASVSRRYCLHHARLKTLHRTSSITFRHKRWTWGDITPPLPRARAS